VLYHVGHVPSPFGVSYLLNRVLLLCPVSLDHDPPIYVSYVAGMTGITTTPSFLLVEMGSHEHFPKVALSYNPPVLCFLGL
jgi:hypothetical protein